FYGFGHQGEDGQRIDHTTVEDIARHFIDEMRSVRPRGPYLLGGYSFGGIVAYEMARQLAASGEDVPLLALFDTYAPEDGMRAAAQDETMLTPLKRLAVRRLVKHYLDRGMVVPPRLRHFHTIDTYRRATSAYK